MTTGPGIAVTGASGRMGRMLIETIRASTRAHLVGAVERTGHSWVGQDVGTAMGGQPFRRSEPLEFKSIAIVSANKGFTQAVQMFGMLFHADVKVFGPDSQGEAISWLEK